MKKIKKKTNNLKKKYPSKVITNDENEIFNNKIISDYIVKKTMGIKLNKNYKWFNV